MEFSYKYVAPPVEGLLEYGEVTPTYSEDKQKTGTTFNVLGKLYFSKMRHEESDYDVVNTYATKTDLKVRTWYDPFFESFNEKHMIRIGVKFYEIVKLDHDSRYIYFYLQEVVIEK